MHAFALHACIRIAFKEIHAFASHALFSITRLIIGWNGLSPSPTMQTVLPELGDHWDGGPLRTVYPGLRWGTNELGDQWKHGKKGYTGGLMRWDTNEICVPRFTLGDQWDRGPMRTAYPGLHRGTYEMGDQWEHGRKGYTGGLMRTNENCITRITLGDKRDGGPMRTV